MTGAAMSTKTIRLRLMVALIAAAVAITAGVLAFGDREPRPTASPVDVEAPAGSDVTPREALTSAAPGVPKPIGPVKARPLRAGERRTTLQVPAAYSPSSPTGAGTDDYRCFMLDPGLTQDAWLTGTQILPDNAEVVHHVILFRLDAESVADAEAEDAKSPEPGWTCFGGMGLEGEFSRVDDAAWLGAWAPGGRESVVRDGYGVSLDQGTRIVMQVHYNLLIGDGADQSATQIRWRPKTGSDLKAINTVLLPAPVEMPCRPAHALGPLCDREASVADAQERFGERGGMTANLLHVLCGTQPYPSEITSCTREMSRGMTILGAAGHMHLLGSWLKIEVNPATPGAKTLLEIPLWNFDDQTGVRIDPVRVEAGETVRITCKHSQELRDLLPAFDGTQEKYVVWGEGTTDEMCLGILQVAFDDPA
jgi:hypothetical protein